MLSAPRSRHRWPDLDTSVEPERDPTFFEKTLPAILTVLFFLYPVVTKTAFDGAQRLLFTGRLSRTVSFRRPVLTSSLTRVPPVRRRRFARLPVLHVREPTRVAYGRRVDRVRDTSLRGRRPVLRAASGLIRPPHGADGRVGRGRRLPDWHLALLRRAPLAGLSSHPRRKGDAALARHWFPPPRVRFDHLLVGVGA